MKRILITLAVAMTLAYGWPIVARAEVDPAVLAAERERVAVMERACSAAVAIFAPGGQGGGSGVVISADGYALSNFHVTSACGVAMKCGMDDGKLYDAVIVGIDPTGDLAMIKLLGRDDFPFAELADSDQVKVGDWCFAVGNPFLLATDFHPSVSYGVISGSHRYQYPEGTFLEYTDCLQADAAINPGNSGGPLFNSEGRVIGINGRGSFEKRGRVNVGVGYAISSNQIKRFVGDLKSGRLVDHATLGARVITGEEHRVVVDEILEDSDAYRRGLRYSDEILSFGGRSITTVNSLKNILGTFPKGWRAPLTFRSKEATVETLVRLPGMHSEAELQKLFGAAEPKQELPNPDEKQPDGKKKPDKPKPPGRPKQARRAAEKKAPVPEIVKQHYVERPGYVNYYFNRVERDRVWKAFVARGDFSSVGGEWLLAGDATAGGERVFALSDAMAIITSPGGELRIDAKDQLNGKLDPPGSGGLLAALSLWRRLLIDGPEKFGDVYYVGAAPLAGHDGLCDVLAAARQGVETRFYFDPASGELAALEMYPDDNDDPCELTFGDYRPVEGRSLPHEIQVRAGDNVYLVLKLTRASLAPGKDK